MKTLSNQLVRTARIAAVTANTSDLISSICDMANCESATAYITADCSSDAIVDLTFWTSSSDTCIASGTAQSATTNTVKVAVASDADGLQAWNASNVAITGLTVSSNAISTIDSDCTVAIELPDIRRYLVAQYTGTGTGSYFGMVFIGRDGAGAVSAGVRAEY